MGKEAEAVSDYGELLKDPRWQRKRLSIFERDAWACRDCFASDKPLHVHHLKYIHGRKPWQYADGDLLTLCEDCHDARHKKPAPPPTNLDRDTIDMLSRAQEFHRKRVFGDQG